MAEYENYRGVSAKPAAEAPTPHQVRCRYYARWVYPKSWPNTWPRCQRTAPWPSTPPRESHDGHGLGGSLEVLYAAAEYQVRHPHPRRVDVVQVCAQMGHADVSTTLKIHTHLDAVHNRKSVDKPDLYLAGKKAENE